MGYIQSLFSNAITGSLSVIIYIVIVLLFIMGVVRCILPVMRTKATLRKAIRSVRDSEEDAKYAWQDDDFLGKGPLFSHWSDYLNNLFFADGAYHNASHVEDFINEETVIYGPGRSNFAEAVPGLLTSLGFLGTLIGLARGLAGFSMSDADSVQRSIVTLIPGMRYAFTTSIFGVVGSVLFTLITRAVYGSAEHTLIRFYSAMSRYAGIRSVDPMTQIAIYQQDQTAMIQSMLKGLDKTVSEAVAKGVEPLNQSLKNFVNINTQEQMRFLDAVMVRFAERMDESMNGKVKRFGDVLDETARLQQENCVVVRASLAGAKEALESLDKLQTASKQIVDSVAGYVAQLNAASAQSEAANARIASSIEQMELVARQQNGYLKAVSAAQIEANQSIEAMQKAAKDLRGAAAHVEKLHLQANQSIDEELSSMLDAYRDYVNQFTQRVDYLSTHIAGSLEQMPEAVSDTNERFLDQMDRLTDTLAQAQSALEAAVERLYHTAR